MNAAAAARARSPAALKTLCLNADYQPLATWPLSLITAQEAVHALYRDKVVLVESWEGAFFRSPSRAIAVPKVVALKTYASVNADPKFCRRSILLRDRYRCQYCGERFEARDLTFDHVVPRSAGGRTEWTNILTACIPCNSRKGARAANYSGRRGVAGPDGRMRPLKAPRRPTCAELLRSGLEFLPNDVRESWADFLYWHVELQPS